MRVHPVLQSGLGFVMMYVGLRVVPDLAGRLGGYHSPFVLLMALLFVPGLVLAFTGLARGVLRLVGFDSWRDAGGWWQTAALAFVVFLLVALPLAVSIGIAATN